MDKATRNKFLGVDQIFDYLTEKLLNENIDFVAFVVSPFHILGVDAYLLEMKEKYNKHPKGIIFIFPHPKNGIIVNEEHIKCRKFADVEIVYIEDSQVQKKKDILCSMFNTLRGILYVISQKNSDRKELFIISVMHPYFSIFEIFSNKKIAEYYLPTFVVIDEGVGSYMSKKIWELVSKYDKGIKENITFLNTIKDTFKDIILLILQIIKKPIFYIIKVENRLIFNKYNNILIPNSSVINSYRKVLKFEKDISNKRFILTTKKPTIVIGTQPFVEYDQITESKFIELIDEIITFLEEKGFFIILKPHPRELLNKYRRLSLKHKNLTIAPNSVLLEDILLSCSPTTIIGFTSTSLITSKLFYNIYSISIIDIMIKLSDDPLLKILAKEFKLKFQNIICFIDCIKELTYVIEKLK
ncbi:hypothetical protein KKP89_03990 [Methanothermococcus sp. SCGC AD-155-N22]|nr:hypothetical protein [Methanothermococcus sp. SCGC AD-155-N22]MBW9220552.1 hypothetical protein [Methanothermococcus sp. SCGC AD-155-N22]